MTGKFHRTIGYLRVSTGTQDLKKNRAEILAFANEKDLGRVEFVEETASGRTAWRDRKIATVLDGLGTDTWMRPSKPQFWISGLMGIPKLGAT